MVRRRRELGRAWLYERYVVRRWSTQRIASVSGWSSQYVRDRLRDWDIALRRPGAGVRAVEEQLDAETLAGLLGQGLSVAQVAERVRYSRSGVCKLIRENGLQDVLATTRKQRRTAASDEHLTAEVGRLYAVGG